MCNNFIKTPTNIDFYMNSSFFIRQLHIFIFSLLFLFFFNLQKVLLLNYDSRQVRFIKNRYSRHFLQRIMLNEFLCYQKGRLWPGRKICP